MRLVFVNHAHPDIAHVSGMRLGNFAIEMSQRGHQVVLLTCTLPGSTGTDPVGPRLSAMLENHDWTQPLVVAVPSRRMRSLELIRQNKVPALLRRALTLWQFVVNGGMFADWQKAASGAAFQLADEFEPDLVWGTFGNTSNLVLAQALARRARCGWTVDAKDNWNVFVPAALRKLMAKRFRDMAGWTSNSKHHQEMASTWFAKYPFKVIYSGVAEDFFQRAAEVTETENCDLLLVGSTYDREQLQGFLGAVRDWVNSLPPSQRDSMRFVYAGSDTDRVTAALNEQEIPCRIELMRHVTIAELAALARGSFACSYISAAFTFHHKLLELLVSGQPLICFPGESAEGRALAARTGVSFAPCESRQELLDALTGAWAERCRLNQRAEDPVWRWSDFAVSLEEFFESAVRERQS